MLRENKCKMQKAFRCSAWRVDVGFCWDNCTFSQQRFEHGELVCVHYSTNPNVYHSCLNLAARKDAESLERNKIAAYMRERAQEFRDSGALADLVLEDVADEIANGEYYE